MPDIDIDFSVKGRDRVMRYVADKYGRDSRRPDRHLRPHASRARPRATRRACSTSTTARATGSRSSSPTRSWAARRRSRTASKTGGPRAGGRRGPAGQADHRRRAGPRGDRAQLLDPRGRRRDRAGAAHEHRAAPARGGHRQGGRGRQQAAPHRHAVLDEADRGARAAEDGLPRAAQPRRDRGGARHHRAVHRRAARHGHAAARRLEDLRDAPARPLRSACSSSSPTGCATRCGRSSRPSSRTSSRWSRCTAGRHAPHRHLRAQQAQPDGVRTSTSGCGRSRSPPTR